MSVQKRYYGVSDTPQSKLDEIFLVNQFIDAIEAGVWLYMSKESRGSKSLQDAIDTALQDLGFDSNFRFQPVGTKHQANFELDFKKTHDSSGKIVHVGGELAFDNRQVIFTNVIKADLAMKRLRDASLDGRSLSIIVSFCSDSRGLASWDNSVATYEEYANQLEWGLDGYLTGPLLLLGLTQPTGGVD